MCIGSSTKLTIDVLQLLELAYLQRGGDHPRLITRFNCLKPDDARHGCFISLPG